MKLRLLAAFVVLLALSVPARAQGLNFTFSFYGTSSDPNHAGEITGEIYGLTDNSSNNQTNNVTLFSAPVGFGVTSPVNFQSFSGFTVSNGTLTSVNFSAYDVSTALYLNLDDNPYTSNDELLYEGTPNASSMAAHTSILATAYAPAPVPEPTQYDLFILLAIVGLVGGKRVHDRLKPPV